MKSFLIHRNSCVEREDCVKAIVDITGCTIVEPVWCPTFPVLGCLLSHIGVAEKGEGGYFVFEDDCVVLDKDFLNLPRDADIVYYGINGKAKQIRPITCEHYWGTHAMYVSEKARLILLENWTKELEFKYPNGFPAVDEMISVLIARHNLTVKIYDSIKQKSGLKSYISGNTRR